MKDKIRELQREISHPKLFHIPNSKSILLKRQGTFNQPPDRSQRKPKITSKVHRPTIIDGPFKALQKNRASFPTHCPNTRTILFPTNKRARQVFLDEVLGHRALGLLAILQQSLASKASFLALIWKMPRPPFCLGRVTTFQLTRCNFRFSWVDPQRNLLD